MEILRVENLQNIWQGNTSVTALDNIFSVNKGEFVAIIGPSGSGTYLLYIIGGVDTPTSGKVFVENQDIYSLDESQLAI